MFVLSRFTAYLKYKMFLVLVYKMKQLDIDFSQTCNALREKGIEEPITKYLDLWFLQHNMNMLDNDAPSFDSKFNGIGAQLLQEFQQLSDQYVKLQQRKESLQDWEAINKSYTRYLLLLKSS